MMKTVIMMNKYQKIYLDDIRNPKTNGWIVIRTYREFVDWITENGIPDEVSFDHDLSIEPTSFSTENKEYTGYDAAKWLGQYCWENGIPIPKWNVHSANPVGKENITNFLKNMEKKLN